MLKQSIIVVMGLGLLAGCTTTKNLASNIGIGKKVVSTPLEQVLKTHPEIQSELTNTEIRQVFNAVEAPTVAQVTVLQSGLLDDSVNAIRTTYRFKFSQNDVWQKVDKVTEYKCVRGKNSKNFQKQICA